MVEPLPVETDCLSPDLFQQFRQRYPTGSLTSELVRVQEQTFVVQVRLNVADKTVVTALAADAVLEVAEDRARQRAFTLLGIDAAMAALPRVEKAVEPPPVPPAMPPTPRSKVPTAAPKAAAPTQPVAPAVTPPKAVLPSVEAPDEAADLASALAPEMPPEEVELTAPLDLLQDPAAPAAPMPAPQTAAAPAPKATMAAPITAPQVQISTQTVPLPAPIDLSDVIAQTDVELKRLAWSVGDGREYLVETYGKRSRHDLTDEELLAFLLHLEALPTPALS